MLLWCVPLVFFGCRFAQFPSETFHRWNIWDCGALFTRAAEVWGDLAVQVRADARQSWVQVDLETISPQGLAGYRQRIDRVMEEVYKRRKRLDLFPRLCADIAAKHEAAGGGRVTEMQILKTNWRAGTPPMAQPAGHWNPPPVNEVPKAQRVLLHQARLVEGVWRETKLDPAANPPPVAAGRVKPPARPNRQVRILPPKPAATTKPK